MEAGGSTPEADMKKVSIIRIVKGEHYTQNIDMRPILHGEPTPAVYVANGDVIYVRRSSLISERGRASDQRNVWGNSIAPAGRRGRDFSKASQIRNRRWPKADGGRRDAQRVWLQGLQAISRMLLYRIG